MLTHISFNHFCINENLIFNSEKEYREFRSKCLDDVTLIGCAFDALNQRNKIQGDIPHNVNAYNLMQMLSGFILESSYNEGKYPYVELLNWSGKV